jgi:hypothetical protein
VLSRSPAIVSPFCPLPTSNAAIVTSAFRVRAHWGRVEWGVVVLPETIPRRLRGPPNSDN